MKSEWLKFPITYGVSLLVGAYKAFVLMLMWNWFVTPIFHTESISFWQVLGLLWVVQLFVDGRSDDTTENWRWEKISLMLNACIPEHSREELMEELKQVNEGVWGEIGTKIFSHIVGYSFALALGWTLHSFFIGA